MAATSGRNTSQTSGDVILVPVKAKTVIYEGTMVAIDSNGYAIAAKKAADLIIAGRAEESSDGSADTVIKVRRGCFKWANASSGTIAKTDILKNCYVADNETVTITASGSSVAGKVIAVDDDGVFIEMR